MRRPVYCSTGRLEIRSTRSSSFRGAVVALNDDGGCKRTGRPLLPFTHRPHTGRTWGVACAHHRTPVLLVVGRLHWQPHLLVLSLREVLDRQMGPAGKHTMLECKISQCAQPQRAEAQHCPYTLQKSASIREAYKDAHFGESGRLSETMKRTASMQNGRICILRQRAERQTHSPIFVGPV